jgi:hypothetical protein
MTREFRPTREEIEEALAGCEEPILLMDNLDEAFIGLSRRINEPTLAVYSWDRIIDCLMSNDGMTYDEAVEFAEFNIAGAWVGERTPIIVYPMDWF